MQLLLGNNLCVKKNSYLLYFPLILYGGAGWGGRGRAGETEGGAGERDGRSGGETAVEVRGDGREETEGQGNGAQKW